VGLQFPKKERSNHTPNGINRALASSNDFAYYFSSEIVGAEMSSNTYNYAYDPIGNRLSVSQTVANASTGWKRDRPFVCVIVMVGQFLGPWGFVFVLKASVKRCICPSVLPFHTADQVYSYFELHL
jgi:hypothetical protein